MVEVPAAALKAAAFAPHVDFLSHRHQRPHPVRPGRRARQPGSSPRWPTRSIPGVLALDRGVCRRRGCDVLVAVCGELAGDEQAAAVLLGLGVRELSVVPAAVAGVKEAVRHVDLAAAEELARQALAAPDAATVRRMLTSG